MIVVVLELLGHIHERFAGRVDVELAVHDPALLRAVLNRVPDVAVAGDDAVALRLQLFSSGPELIPARTDLGSDDGGIVGAPDVLGDRAAIDERAAGSLIAKANDLAIRRTGADIDGVLSDVRSLDGSSGIDAQIVIRGSVGSHIALRILEDERSLGAVDVRSVSAAGGQSLVKRGLIQAVGGRDDGGVQLIAELGMGVDVVLEHGGHFVGEGVQIDNALLSAGKAHAGKHHHESQNQRQQFLHTEGLL